MGDPIVLSYTVSNQFELNLSYMPFIIDGGIFVPTLQVFALGDKISLELTLPNHKDIHTVDCRVIWVTPKNSLHHNVQGIGLQFMGESAKGLHELIQANLDNSFDIGGYTYGMSTHEQYSNKT